MQVLKPEVRERIRRAALAEFAAAGAASATMNAIARRADVGAATLYNYYANKEALLLDVISPELAKQFERALDERVRALGFLATTAKSDYSAASLSAEALLQFWLRHRLEVVVLLDRAQGTRYAGFGQRFVARLMRLTLSSLRASSPGLKLNARQRLVLSLIFENTRRTLAAILERCPSESALREALGVFWAHQLPGMQGLAKTLLAHT